MFQAHVRMLDRRVLDRSNVFVGGECSAMIWGLVGVQNLNELIQK